MATVYAQANGNASEINWNTAANGNGDTVTWANIPAGDTADANGYTVELDVGATGKTLALLTNTTGGFTCNLSTGGDRTITCDVTAGGAHCITASGGSTYLLTIAGNATGSASGSYHGVYVSASGANVTITGDSNGGSAAYARGAYNNSTGTLTVDGNATGGSALNAQGVCNASTGTIIIGGTVIGGSNNLANGVFNSSANGIVILSDIIDFSAAASPIGGFTNKLYYTPAAGKYCKFSTSTGTVNCPEQLDADEVKKNVVHGTVTGTYKPWQVKGVDF
jgi:hypothetical protein